LTIWLLTLPEKFKEWYEFNKKEDNEKLVYKFSSQMDYKQTPKFPVFEKITELNVNPESRNYNFLPDTWELNTCFEYYLNNPGLWTTNSIEEEYDFEQDNIPDEDTDVEDDLSHSTSKLEEQNKKKE